MITGSEDGPVEGLKLAAIQEPITYLLYAARWFPTTGYMTDRFTAEMHIRVPQGMRVFASGSTGRFAFGHARRRQARRPVRLQLDQARVSRHRDRRPLRESGRRRAGQREGLSHRRPPACRPTNWPRPPTKQFDFFTDNFGGLESPHLNVVEMPDDTLPAVWGPELAGMMGSRIGDKSGVRLLANTIAHQWWGSEVSPKTLNDAWITNGMARYGELMYVEEENGKNAMRAGAAGRRRRRARLRHHPALEFRAG